MLIDCLSAEGEAGVRGVVLEFDDEDEKDAPLLPFPFPTEDKEDEAEAEEVGDFEVSGGDEVGADDVLVFPLSEEPSSTKIDVDIPLPIFAEIV